MLGLGRVAGQTRPREPRRNLLPLLQMLMLLMSWATISQQGPRHLQEHEGPELLKNVHYEQQQRKKHRSTTARPPLPLLLRTDRAKQASARAAVFHWCCVETHWTEHGPRLVPCTAANWLKQMETAVPEAEQESKAGSNGPLQMKAGATCAKFCKGNSQESDCCTGRTGVWPMQGATARQASSDHRVPWTGSPECCPHTLAPWRARNLRAARFQHPRLGMRKAKPSRASPGSVQTEQADPTGAAAYCLHQHFNKAHNHNSPRLPMQSLCIDNSPNKAHNPKKQGMPGKRKSNSVPSGPKSGDCRRTKPAIQVLMLATVGARVSSAAAVTEDGLGLRPGKHHGKAHQGREPIYPTKNLKRAFNRACRRANQSLQEGTWYRNRWHTRATLNALRVQPPTALTIIPRVPRTARAQPRSTTRPEFRLRVFAWNAGGLSAAMTQELMAWCDTREATEKYDVIIISETHWRQVDDYRSGQWLCIHSTGHKEGSEPDRYAGILCMLSCKCFAEPRVKEHVQGRLLQVTATHHRSQMPVCVVGLYQHVWRPHLSAAQNRSLRSHIWHSLQALITATPARHQLIIAGDFNATLTPMHPHVGPSVPKPATHANHDRDLQTLLKECDLCAVNTWHSRPHHTFTSPSVRSQLDYVLLRTPSANRQAKQAAPMHSFPVGAYRQTNHHPVQAVIQMLPMAYRASKPQADFRFEAAALQSAVSQNSEAAQALQQAVATRLSALPPGAALCTEHDTVNTILLEETCRAFPPAQRADHRVSANQGYRASAGGTWQLHHQLRRSGMPSLRNIWARWRLYAQFMRASAMLRRQSKDLKRQFLEDQMRQAETTATSS